MILRLTTLILHMVIHPRFTATLRQGWATQYQCMNTSIWTGSASAVVMVGASTRCRPRRRLRPPQVQLGSLLTGGLQPVNPRLPLHPLPALPAHPRLPRVTRRWLRTGRRWVFDVVLDCNLGSTTSNAQCAGLTYKGPTQCIAPYKCTYFNDWYSQCL